MQSIDNTRASAVLTVDALVCIYSEVYKIMVFFRNYENRGGKDKYVFSGYIYLGCVTKERDSHTILVGV